MSPKTTSSCSSDGLRRAPSHTPSDSHILLPSVSGRSTPHGLDEHARDLMCIPSLIIPPQTRTARPDATLSASARPSTAPQPELCSICHEPLCERVVQLRCAHSYHLHCIKDWRATQALPDRPPTAPNPHRPPNAAPPTPEVGMFYDCLLRPVGFAFTCPLCRHHHPSTHFLEVPVVRAAPLFVRPKPWSLRNMYRGHSYSQRTDGRNSRRGRGRDWDEECEEAEREDEGEGREW